VLILANLEIRIESNAWEYDDRRSCPGDMEILSEILISKPIKLANLAGARSLSKPQGIPNAAAIKITAENIRFAVFLVPMNVHRISST
jgi:hypothetical protein